MRDGNGKARERQHHLPATACSTMSKKHVAGQKGRRSAGAFLRAKLLEDQ